MGLALWLFALMGCETTGISSFRRRGTYLLSSRPPQAAPGETPDPPPPSDAGQDGGTSGDSGTQPPPSGQYLPQGYMPGAAPLAASVARCNATAPELTGDFHEDCVRWLNEYRWQCQRLPPLTRWNAGESCADQQAQYDHERNAPHAGFQANVGGCSARGQNEAPGWPEAQLLPGMLRMMWQEVDTPSGEQGHYLNMSNRTYTSVACGIYAASPSDATSVQNFR